MRRTLLFGLVAASLGMPSLALAVKNAVTPDQPQPGARRVINPQQLGNGDNATHGGGMFGGAEPGHVTGPGRTPPDTESRGPINDVIPGAGNADTPQSKNPKPVR